MVPRDKGDGRNNARGTAFLRDGPEGKKGASRVLCRFTSPFTRFSPEDASSSQTLWKRRCRVTAEPGIISTWVERAHDESANPRDDRRARALVASRARCRDRVSIFSNIVCTLRDAFSNRQRLADSAPQRISVRIAIINICLKKGTMCPACFEHGRIELSVIELLINLTITTIAVGRF